MTDHDRRVGHALELYVSHIRWPDGRARCPYCDSINTVLVSNSFETGYKQLSPYKCLSCAARFNSRMKTALHGTSKQLVWWFRLAKYRMERKRIYAKDLVKQGFAATLDPARRMMKTLLNIGDLESMFGDLRGRDIDSVIEEGYRLADEAYALKESKRGARRAKRVEELKEKEAQNEMPLDPIELSQADNVVYDHFVQALKPELVKDNVLCHQIKEFIKARKEMRRTMTTRAATMAANKLNEHDAMTCRIAIKNSIENSWTGVFPESVKIQDIDKELSEKLVTGTMSESDIVIDHLKYRFANNYVDGYSGLQRPAHNFYRKICYPLLRNGRLLGTSTPIEFVDAMFDMMVEFCARKKIVKGMYESCDLLNSYVHWLASQEWLDSAGARAFSLDSSLFHRYLQEESRYNNDRNPMTGRGIGQYGDW